METNARYFSVGLFVVFFSALLVIVVAWIGNSGFVSGHPKYYHIYFNGSVQGLKQGEKVTYYGVPIGRVEKIDVDPYLLERIQVLVSITDPLLIRRNAVATLQVKGVTGQAEIHIHGGSRDQPLVSVKPGETYPVIASERSKFQELIETAPQIFEKAILLADELRPVFNKDNRAAFSQILKNLAIVSTEFGENAENIGTTIQELHKSLAILNKILKKADGVGEDVESMIKEINEILKDTRESFTDLINSGGYEVPKLLYELRTFTQTLNRVTGHVEHSPLGSVLKPHNK